jgi:hypothetical protein
MTDPRFTREPTVSGPMRMDQHPDVGVRVSAALLATAIVVWLAAVIAGQFGFRPVPELPLVADGASEPTIIEVDAPPAGEPAR